jgi:hypothetical protein
MCAKSRKSKSTDWLNRLSLKRLVRDQGHGVGIYYFGGVHHLWHNPGTTPALKMSDLSLSFQPPMGNFSEGVVNALSRRAAPEQVPFISSSLLLRYSFAFAFLGWNILWPQSIYLQS